MDKETFQELYIHHYKKLYLVAYQYIRDETLAEEIIHEVFLKIWKNKLEITIHTNPRSYIFQAVVNTSLNYIEKEKRLRKLEKVYLEEFMEFQTWEEAEKLEKKLILLEKAINSLPPQCQKVIRLSKIKGLKQKEIAEELDISIKTVKNHISYGYDKIRNLSLIHI